MSLKEVELAIKALTIALQTLQPHQGLNQDPSDSPDTDAAKFILQDQDLLDDDIEIVESYTPGGDVLPHQRIVNEATPSYKPQVKSIKSEQGDKRFRSGQEAAYRKATKGGNERDLLRRRLLKAEARLATIENGILVNLATIQEHLKSIKGVQQELSKCRALCDNQP